MKSHRHTPFGSAIAVCAGLLAAPGQAAAIDCTRPAYHPDGITIEMLMERAAVCFGRERGVRLPPPPVLARPAPQPPSPAPGPSQAPAPAWGSAACPQAAAGRLQGTPPEGETWDAMPFTFPRGDARLPDSALASLTNIATFLRANPDIRLTLVGHADATGNDAINDPLSAQRALAASAFIGRLAPDAAAAGRVLAFGAGARELRPEVSPCDAGQRRLELRMRR